MRAGPLRHRIAFEAPADTEDDLGGVTTTWSPVATVRGSIEPLTGREGMAGQQILAGSDTRLRIRWSPRMAGCLPTWRALHGGVVYNIVHVSHVRLEQRMIELLCKSGTNEG